MALITIPSNTDLCAWLAQLTVSDIVFATAEADYVQEDLCGLGAQIIAEPANANSGYLMAVIDPDDDCLKWMAQPAPAVYDSTIMKPLILSKTETYASSPTQTDKCKIDLAGADFPVAMKLLVTYTVMGRGDVAGYVVWQPRGIVAGVVSDLVTGNIETDQVLNYPNWSTSQFTTVLDIPANPVGLYLAITFQGWSGGCGLCQTLLQIDAIAFKA